jgi:hypothetical protein
MPPDENSTVLNSRANLDHFVNKNSSGGSWKLYRLYHPQLDASVSIDVSTYNGNPDAIIVAAKSAAMPQKLKYQYMVWISPAPELFPTQLNCKGDFGSIRT